MTEGWFEQVFPGKVLAARGVPIDDRDGVYSVRVRLIIVWPVDEDAKLIGEDSYINGSMFDPANVRKLRRDEIPDTFFAHA